MEPSSLDGSVSRRGFLIGAIGVLSAAIGAVLGGSGLGYFISPALRKREESWVDVGRAADFKPGAPVRVEFVERRRDAWVTTERRSSAWVLTSDGKDFISYDPRCTHLGCPFRWDDEKKEFLCPCHTAVFGVDGRVVSGPPPRPLDRYQTKVMGGRLMILPSPQKRETA